MTKSKKFLSALLAFTIMITTAMFASTTAYATNFYTQEDINQILSCNYDVSDLTAEGDVVFNYENFPVRNRFVPNESTYYVCFKDDAKMLEFDYFGGDLSKEDYADLGSQQWVLVFTEDDPDAFILAPSDDVAKCLKVDTSNGNVYIDYYIENYDSPDDTQYWSIVITSQGNKLVSKSEAMEGQALYFENNTFKVSSTDVSYVGFFNMGYWKPCENISVPNMSLNTNQIRVFNAVCTDSYGNTSTDIPGSMWFSHEVVDGQGDVADFYPINSAIVDSVKGKFIGIEKMRMTCRITGATTTYDVIVNMPNSLTIDPVLADRPLGTIGLSNSCWAACAEIIGKHYSANNSLTQSLLMFKYDYLNMIFDPDYIYILEEATGYTATFKYDGLNMQAWCNEIGYNQPFVMVFEEDKTDDFFSVIVTGCYVSGTYDNPIYSFTIYDTSTGDYTTYDNMVNNGYSFMFCCLLDEYNPGIQ